MEKIKLQLTIGQLEPIKGSMTHIKIDKQYVDPWKKSGRQLPRVICRLDDQVEYGCGFSHYGDGHYFIIVSKDKLKQLHKTIGDVVDVEIWQDPNPLGVAEPEVLTVLLQEDPGAKAIYDTLTDGKKRALIFSIIKIKSIDIQVRKITEFLDVEADKLNKRGK